MLRPETRHPGIDDAGNSSDHSLGDVQRGAGQDDMNDYVNAESRARIDGPKPSQSPMGGRTRENGPAW